MKEAPPTPPVCESAVVPITATGKWFIQPPSRNLPAASAEGAETDRLCGTYSLKNLEKKKKREIARSYEEFATTASRV